MLVLQLIKWGSEFFVILLRYFNIIKSRKTQFWKKFNSFWILEVSIQQEGKLESCANDTWLYHTHHYPDVILTPPQLFINHSCKRLFPKPIWIDCCVCVMTEWYGHESYVSVMCVRWRLGVAVVSRRYAQHSPVTGVSLAICGIEQSSNRTMFCLHHRHYYSWCWIIFRVMMMRTRTEANHKYVVSSPLP